MKHERIIKDQAIECETCTDRERALIHYFEVRRLDIVIAHDDIAE